MKTKTHEILSGNDNTILEFATTQTSITITCKNCKTKSHMMLDPDKMSFKSTSGDCQKCGHKMGLIFNQHAKPNYRPLNPDNKKPNIHVDTLFIAASNITKVIGIVNSPNDYDAGLIEGHRRSAMQLRKLGNQLEDCDDHHDYNII